MKDNKFCTACGVKLTFRNTPIFSGGKLSDGGRICRKCFSKLSKINPQIAMNSKKFATSKYAKEVVENYESKKQEKKLQKQKQNATPKTDNSYKEKTSIPTISSLLNAVKDLNDIKKLEKEYLKYENKYRDDDSDNIKIEELYSIYEDAYHKALDKTLYYQFIPHIDLNTPKRLLEVAFEVYDIDKYRDIRKIIGGSETDWIEIKGNDLLDDNIEDIKEPKPTYINSLIAFRDIVESEVSYHEKKQLINELTDYDKSFKDEFFDLANNEKAGDYWMKEYLKSFGVPLVDKLYELGYDTPEKISDININEIMKVSGFGPQKTEKLIQAKNKLLNYYKNE
ncbi:MAG: helix-hairpin-helix domain-containing protein [Candidatus Woesearchaeota archaeon]